MVSTRTLYKMMSVSEAELNKMFDKLSEENAKYMLKIALKTIMPSDEEKRRTKEFLGIAED